MAQTFCLLVEDGTHFYIDLVDWNQTQVAAALGPIKFYPVEGTPKTIEDIAYFEDGTPYFMGYRITEATSQEQLQQFLQLLDDASGEPITIDIANPEMIDWDTTEKIQRHPFYKDIILPRMPDL